MMSEFKSDIQALVTRTEHIESKMADFATSHNLLIDFHSALEEEVHWLANKVLDLEDWFWRNNIHLRGIPESVAPEELKLFFMDLMALTLPNLTAQELIIDRIHRIPKPRQLPAQVPKDTITRIHFFQVKDGLLRALRS